jgi:hypothetical protein
MFNADENIPHLLDGSIYCPLSAQKCSGAEWELRNTGAQIYIKLQIVFDSVFECRRFLDDWTTSCAPAGPYEILKVLQEG